MGKIYGLLATNADTSCSDITKIVMHRTIMSTKIWVWKSNHLWVCLFFICDQLIFCSL